MSRLFQRSRQLQWQLSLSYILVILTTIPTLLVVGWAVTSFTAPFSGLSPSAQLVQSLETQVNVITQKAKGAPLRSLDLQQMVGTESFLRSLDVNHMIGAATISDTGQPLATIYKQRGSLTDTLLVRPPTQAIVRAAFANDQRPADLAHTFADGQTVAAVPLLDPTKHDQPFAVLLVVVSSVPSNPIMVLSSPISGQTAATEMLPLAFLLVVAIGAIGALFGVVTARRITRRLHRITAAVHAWSGGDFQVAVDDASSDELGQLGQDLNRMAQQVRTLLTTRQQVALLEERQRVARDLHDSVKQQTFAITLLIDAAKKALDKNTSAARRYLTEAEELTDQTRQELTAIIQEMRPLALLEKGLRAVLQDYIDRWSHRAAIATAVQFQHVEQALAPQIEEALLRVTQEALANIARHSGASQVSVALTQADDQLHLQVRDNGQGFDVAHAGGKGLGLSSMRERLASLQGTLCIESNTSGTRIEARLPSGQACAGGGKGAGG